MQINAPTGWRLGTLGDFTRLENARVGPADIAVYSSTKYHGLVPSESYFKKRIASENTSNYRIVRPGWIAYATNHLTEGSIGINNNNFYISVSPIYTVISVNEFSEPRYLIRLLKNDRLIARYKYFENASVERRGSVNYRNFATIEAVLPPLPEQMKINAVLDTLDTVIERTDELVQKLKLVRAGLLHDLMTRGLDGQGQLRDPVRNPEAFKDSELGRVPRAWAVKRLDEVTRIRRGASPRPIDDPKWFADSGPGWIRIVDVTRSKGVLNATEQYLSPLGAARSVAVQPGQVIMSIAATVGEPALVKISACIHDGFVIFDQHEVNVQAEYLVVLLKSRQQYLRGQGQTGTQANLNTSIVSSTQVALPSLTEQVRILSAIDTQNLRIDKEQAQLDKLRLLKRGLMEDLLTGRVRVSLPEVELDTATVPFVPAETEALTRSAANFRASPGANPAAQGAWVEQVRAAVANQQVGTYSPEALDALLLELAALSADSEGILRVPELLASVGIRFMLLAHPAGSRTSGAAFYLYEHARTQPVVALSFLRPYLDAFWFNLFHELGHIRLGHAPVFDEELGGKGYADSDEEQAANAFARHVLIPEEVWQPFLDAGLHDSYRIRSFARRMGRHHGTVAGRLGTDTGDWPKFNSPELRPQVKPLLTELAARLKL